MDLHVSRRAEVSPEGASAYAGIGVSLITSERSPRMSSVGTVSLRAHPHSLLRPRADVCRPVGITVSPWILSRNGIVPDDTRLDAHSLASIHMPNRDGFVPDSQPGRL